MPLNQQQIRELEKALAELEAKSTRDLRRDIRQSEDGSFTQLAGEAPDSGDRSVADLNADLEAADMERHGGAIQDVEAARMRIADGTYGECIDCGGEISFERLKVNPTALRCIRCQEQYEKIYGAGPTPSL